MSYDRLDESFLSCLHKKKSSYFESLSHAFQALQPVYLRSSCASQVNRRSDIYVFCASSHHQCGPRGKWIAFVSTTVETSQPKEELAPGAFPFISPSFLSPWFVLMSILLQINLTIRTMSCPAVASLCWIWNRHSIPVYSQVMISQIEARWAMPNKVDAPCSFVVSRHMHSRCKLRYLIICAFCTPKTPPYQEVYHSQHWTLLTFWCHRSQVSTITSWKLHNHAIACLCWLLIFFEGLALLGKIDEQFVEVLPVYEPEDDGKRSKTFVSKVICKTFLSTLLDSCCKRAFEEHHRTFNWLTTHNGCFV